MTKTQKKRIYKLLQLVGMADRVIEPAGLNGKMGISVPRHSYDHYDVIGACADDMSTMINLELIEPSEANESTFRITPNGLDFVISYRDDYPDK